jgi:hypothetical protein
MLQLVLALAASERKVSEILNILGELPMDLNIKRIMAASPTSFARLASDRALKPQVLPLFFEIFSTVVLPKFIGLVQPLETSGKISFLSKSSCALPLALAHLLWPFPPMGSTFI